MNQKNNTKIGHLIYTFNKTLEARINQEISKLIFDFPIIHAFNGIGIAQYEKYLEDTLIEIPNRGHFQGSIDLINKGIEVAESLDIEYLIVTASDSWFTDKEFIFSTIKNMKDNNQYLACCAWGTTLNESIFRVGFSLDFFIIDISWQKQSKLFPIDYENYLSKFLDYNHAMGGTYLIPERAFSYYWLKYWSTKFIDNNLSIEAKNHIHRIIEREPIHDEKYTSRKMSYPEIGLYTFHNAEEQKDILKKLSDTINLGKYSLKLLNL
jgi:hypothetical protein